MDNFYLNEVKEDFIDSSKNHYKTFIIATKMPVNRAIVFHSQNVGFLNT